MAHKSIFFLPLPIEIQFLIFKYEHNLKFKSTLKELKQVCYVCKCKIIDKYNPCFEIYIGNLLAITYHKCWLYKDHKYDRDIIKKVCNEFNIAIQFHQVKIKFVKSGRVKIIRPIDIT